MRELPTPKHQIGDRVFLWTPRSPEPLRCRIAALQMKENVYDGLRIKVLYAVTRLDGSGQGVTNCWFSEDELHALTHEAVEERLRLLDREHDERREIIRGQMLEAIKFEQ